VLPGVLITVLCPVSSFAVWARLIAIDLSLVEHVGVVVAGFAVLHFIVSV